MATLHWYRGETYKFSLLLHDKAGAVTGLLTISKFAVYAP